MHPFEITEYLPDPPADIRVPKDIGNQHHEYFGRDVSSLAQVLSDWLVGLGVEGDVHSHCVALLDHARKECKKANQDCIWLTTRMTPLSSDTYNIPRPHHDGNFITASLRDGEPVYRVGATFVGPGTLLWNASEDDKEAHELVSTKAYARMLAENLDHMDEGLRRSLAVGLEEMGIEKVQPSPGQAVKWIGGTDGVPAIHSEPDMSDMPDGRIL